MKTGKFGTLQTIQPDGTKLYIVDVNEDGKWENGGGRMGGLFFMIGEVQPDLYNPYYIGLAEGYATGMSTFMASGYSVALAFM